MAASQQTKTIYIGTEARAPVQVQSHMESQAPVKLEDKEADGLPLLPQKKNDQIFSDSLSEISSTSSRSSSSVSSIDDQKGGEEASDAEEEHKKFDNFLAGGDKRKQKDDESECTVDLLGQDPLFLVLSEFLMSEKGDNIATVLEKLNLTLQQLIPAVQRT